tara:strand:+ start:3563 stop:4549 length:987 start_codon:yes stop_codon:yes gene_type:complete
MPSKSKAQQRFMGLVHAFNKGDVPASKVSKKVKDVAKDMKKKDVKDFASTKHKGKPEKVKQEAINKIKEMIRLELESCGYTMSAENPNYKLKSPGGTGDEDKKLKENMKDAMKNAIHQVKTFDKPSNKKLMTIKVINKLKEKRNNSKSSSNKKQLQKMIDKVESDYKKGKYLKELSEKMRPAVKKLLKQKGYGPIFQAIDNSKRQFKQMRYSRGEIQDTLIDMFGKEDPKILQKIKEFVNEKVVKVSKKDDIPGNPMKMKGEEKIKKLVYSGSINNKGSYEIKGNKLNVNNIRPRDKGFFVRHFTMGTGFRKANLYYDGVHWQGGKKF